MRKPGKLKRSAWWRRRSRLGRNLLKDESGGVLVYMTVLIPVMMGVIGLAVDGTRFFILNTELQDLSDAAALAGARELDGTDVGLQAARDAARDVVNNDSRWANDADPAVHIVEPVLFCEELTVPTEANPLRDCDPDTYTTDGTIANFIRVTAQPRSTAPSFIAAVAAITGEAAPWLQTSAMAIAGTSIVACNVQPLMLCNPYEPNEFSADPGDQFHFKQKQNTPGDGNWYSPGDFGLLDPPGQDSSTGPELRRLLSQQSPKFCYINRVSPRPGQAVGNIDDAINVRFDLPITGSTHGMNLTPAPNVIKGMRSTHPTGCNYTGGNLVDTPSARLPRDTDLATPSGARSVRIGSGSMSTAAKNAYWQYHYGTDWPTVGVETRYQAYMRELGEDGIAPTVTGLENRPPQCASAAPGDYMRRVISAAIVDCQREGVQGNAASNVRSDKYADFFITEPAVGGEIFAEFVRLLTPDMEDSRLERIVQLYR